jgi:histidyl-tRNA synthetase
MAEKPKKPQKLKARLPRGLIDRESGDILATRAMLDKIQKVYELYGFEPVETPAIEFTDALGKFLPDQDRPNEGVFSFQDDDEQWLSLRYDLTAPLARYVAENYDRLPKPYRSYRAGYVYRNEKPGPGRFRQFMQFDADTVGSASPAADAEICMMAADAMEALGFERGQYVVKVNNRKVLDGLRETLATSSLVSEAQWLTVLRAIDKLDRLGADDVFMLLTVGRKDESGDFTKGAQLHESQALAVMQFLDYMPDSGKQVGQGKFSHIRPGISGSEENLKWLASYAELGATGVEGTNELRAISALVRSAGYGDDRVTIDYSVIRGLEYYTGPVFEVELLIETKDDKGRPVRFGSVGGGGRYDGLVSRFRGEPVPATGFSIGVSRLQAALDLIHKDKTPQSFGPVVVTIMDAARVADYQKLVATLREANIRAELYLGNPKHSVGQQLKYADSRHSPCAIVQGSNEREHESGPQIIVQDLIAGRSIGADITDRDEYLRLKAAAQKAVPEAQLLTAVREILARHNVNWA